MKKKRFFVLVFALFLALLSACGQEEELPKQDWVDQPVLKVTVGETVVYEGRGAVSWRSGTFAVSPALPTLEAMAERMEYDAVKETQAKFSFTLPPNNGVGVSCYQYADGKLTAGKTALSEADGTLELLPGKWIYQIAASWYAEDYAGGGTFTFGVEVQ